MFNEEKPDALKNIIRNPNLNFADMPETQGVLFVGDPHLWSKRPGRRRDESFLNTILNKLTKVASIANNNNLLAVILGDLFHEDDDYEPEMLVKIIKVLQLFKRKPVTIVGNHEKDEWVLKEKNALALLKVTNQIDVIEKNSFWGKLTLTNPKDKNHTHNIAIGGTPYGQTIPYDLTSFLKTEGGSSIRAELDKENLNLAKEKMKSLAGRGGVNLLSESNVNENILPNDEINNQIHEALNCETVIWLTHHDLAFENTYPNSIPLHNIDGVDMMINGHIHGTKKPVKVGNTACYNPGNISRLSIDMAEHLPSVWMWTPFIEKQMPSSKGIMVPYLEQIVLPHVTGEEIFNFEGRHTQKSLIEVLPEEIEHSVFVELLKTENNSNNKTDDGIYLKESMDAIFQEKETIEPVKLILEHLFHKALKE